MVRQCHSNTCPVGVCSQDEALRAKFDGSPEKVINLMSFIAEEVREILAQLGFRSLNEIIGRTELLHQVNRGAEHLDDLDLNPILAKVDAPDHMRRFGIEGHRNEVPDSLDAEMIAESTRLFERGEKVQLTYTVRNTHRAVGTRLAGEITRRFGMAALAPGHVHVRLRGSAGQSLGAFAVQGMKLEVFGEANDYVGKGLSGGTIVVRQLVSSVLPSQTNAIIGNTVLYGATAGRLFAAGRAGERFAVRNSGATAVIEGCGANGCITVSAKLATLVECGYGGRGVRLSDKARQQLARLSAEGWDHLPICVAKTPLSISHDPAIKGVPTDFEVPIEEVKLCAGAGFVYALAGPIMTMPGLGSLPAYRHIDIDDDGEIIGLS